jgi:hypothetical protein
MSWLGDDLGSLSLVDLLLEELGITDNSLGDKYDKTYVSKWENYLGVHVGVCHGPVDRITAIRLNGRYAWKGVASPGQVTTFEAGFPAVVPRYQEDPGSGPFIDVPDVIPIAQPELFGGEEMQGGAIGIVDVLHGGPDQPINLYLQQKLQPPGGEFFQPAYRGILSLVFRNNLSSSLNYEATIWFDIFAPVWANHFRSNKLAEPTTHHTGFYWGAGNTRLPAVSVDLFRAEEGWNVPGGCWYPAKVTVTRDGYDYMNPAHILYQCLTDRRLRRKVPTSLIGDTFTAAADILYAEGHGVGLVWDGQTSLDAFMSDVLRYIDGTIYLSPGTGKLELYLSRAITAEQAADLPIFTARQIRDFGSQTLSSGEDQINTLNLVYTNRDNFKPETITMANPALVATYNTNISDTLHFPGLQDPSLAAEILAREMRSRTSQGISYRGMEFTLLPPENGGATAAVFTLHENAPFRMTIPEHGVFEKVFRAVNIRQSGLDGNTVFLDAIEDVSAADFSDYYEPITGGGWVDNRRFPDPINLANEARLISLPYLSVYGAVGNQGVAGFPPDTAFFAVLADPVDQAAETLQLYSNEDGSVPLPDERIGPRGALCPTSKLDGSVGVADGNGDLITSFKMKDLSRMSELTVIGAWFIVDDEKMLCVDVVREPYDPGYLTLTVQRGILDTVPAAHADGAKMWWFNNATGTSYIGTRFVDGNSPYIFVRSMGFVGGAVVDASTPFFHQTLTNDWFKPYPPANVRIDGAYFPSAIQQDFVITWSGRNRITQSNIYLGWEEAGVLPEEAASYTLEVYNADTDALINRIEGIRCNGPEGYYQYTGGRAGAANYRVVFYAVRAAEASTQAFVCEGKVAGYGLAYGYNYGGANDEGVILAPGETAPPYSSRQDIPCPNYGFVAGRWWHFDAESGDPTGVSDLLDYYSVDGLPVRDSVTPGSTGPWQAEITSARGAGSAAEFVAIKDDSVWIKSAGSAWQKRTATWTGATVTPADIDSVTWTGTEYVALLNGGTDIYTFTGLSDPPTRYGDPGVDNPLADLLAATWLVKIGSNYVAVGAWAEDPSKTATYHSTDLVTWTLGTSGAPPAVADGKNWAYFPPSSRWWVVGSVAGTAKAWKSTNGYSWSAVSVSAPKGSEGFSRPFVFKTGASAYKMQFFAGPWVIATTNGTSFSKTASTVSPVQAGRSVRAGYLPYLTASDSWPGYGVATGEDWRLSMRSAAWSENPALPAGYGGNYFGGVQFTSQELHASPVADFPVGSQYGDKVGYVAAAPEEAHDNGFVIDGPCESHGYVGVSAGKKYFEVQSTRAAASLLVGVTRATVVAAKPSVSSALVSSTGKLYKNGRLLCPGGLTTGAPATESINLPPLSPGATYRVLLDVTGRTCSVYSDETLVATVTGMDTGAVWFPCFSSSTTPLRVNLGQRSFAYPLPSGYSSWM